MEKPIYDFQTQLEQGKRGEAIVFKHLLAKDETIDVKDLSDMPSFQSLGIDALWITEGDSGIMYATFFDVKTDFMAYKSNNFFIETNSTKDKDGCMLTTKSEYFLYYEPVFGKLLYVPIYMLRKRYNSRGISKKHYEVHNKGYESEGILMSLDELVEVIPTMQVEDIERM